MKEAHKRFGRIDLNGNDWVVEGYVENEIYMPWHRTDLSFPTPYISKFPARVPGAIHQDLLEQGMIPDWNIGFNSCASEWINNRNWLYRKMITIPSAWAGQTIFLVAEGLDHSGIIYLNDKYVSHFKGSLKQHRIDLTPFVTPGQSYELQIGFDVAPPVYGYRGYTSKIREIKPRYGYIWDWCPRLVNVGIWDDIYLEAKGSARLEDVIVYGDLAEDNQTGLVNLRGKAKSVQGPLTLRMNLCDANAVTCLRHETKVQEEFCLNLSIPDVNIWWPNEWGDQPIYWIYIELIDAKGTLVDSVNKPLAFRRIRWLQNENAPINAIPYTCEINGKKIFLKGINWVPLSPFYGLVQKDDYKYRLRQYTAMHLNILRVWGGGPIEKESFFDLCDQMGLLVWQEFPLSSSLYDNWPPEDSETIEELAKIAENYILRRAHHPSLAIWCGGNELQGSLDGKNFGEGKPVDLTHPCIRRLGEIVHQLDPSRLFLPSSASGPSSVGKQENFGKGIHHDVHGPWEVPFRKDLTEYWNADDSLFRSEVGIPGMTCMHNMLTCAGKENYWPGNKENNYWLHRASCWLPETQLSREFGPWSITDTSELDLMIRCSQFVQADSYRYIIEACRRRAFELSGVLLWMGHDMIHVPSNNSVIEHDGLPKLAYHLSTIAFSKLHICAKFDSLICPPGQNITGELWAIDEDRILSDKSQYSITLRDIHGTIIEQIGFRGTASSKTVFPVQRFCFRAPKTEHNILLVRCEHRSQNNHIFTDYVLTQNEEYPLAPLRFLPAAKLNIAFRSISRGKEIQITNTGSIAAIGCWPVQPKDLIPQSPWPFIILPNETSNVDVEGTTIDLKVVGLNFSDGQNIKKMKKRYSTI
jgi:beta-mannosidase